MTPVPMANDAEINRLWQEADARFNAGDFDSARHAAESVLALQPLHSRAHMLLSHLYGRDDSFRLATLHAVQAAAKMGPQSVQHIAAVSLRLISVGEYEQAARLIGKLKTSVLKLPAFLVEFSQQLSLIEQHAEALRFMDAAIALGLEADSAAYLRGNYLKFVGRLDEAADEYERALRLNPNFAFAHWALAYLGVRGDHASRAERIRKTLSTTPSANPGIPYLQYALFKELDAIGETHPAWSALEAGARAKKREVSYDAAEEAALFGRLIHHVGSGAIGPAKDAKDGLTPIFVLGMPRTGTTLLERVLGGHPGITLCGELNDFRMQFKWTSDHHSLGFIDDVGIDRIGAMDFDLLGRRYLEHVAWRVPSTRHFSDKNPGNFILAGLILKALPQARIVHLRRQPMDACFSNLKELFAGNSHPYSYDFADLAGHYRNYSRLMTHWHEVAPGRILDLDYEDLVTDPDTSARRVMDYLGLSYDAAQIRIESNATPVSTASSAQVRQPIHGRNIGGWKRYEAQLAPLQAMLGITQG